MAGHEWLVSMIGRAADTNALVLMLVSVKALPKSGPRLDQSQIKSSSFVVVLFSLTADGI